jgi:hypothetical protein
MKIIYENGNCGFLALRLFRKPEKQEAATTQSIVFYE